MSDYPEGPSSLTLALMIADRYRKRGEQAEAEVVSLKQQLHDQAAVWQSEVDEWAKRAGETVTDGHALPPVVRSNRTTEPNPCDTCDIDNPSCGNCLGC